MREHRRSIPAYSRGSHGQLALALSLCFLAACGDEGGGDAAGSGRLEPIGCDRVRYNGVEFTLDGCQDGVDGYQQSVSEGAVFADFDILCEAGCVAAVVVRRGSAQGDSGPDAGTGGTSGAAAFGEACEADDDCGAGLQCDAEVQTSIPVTGLPGNVPDVLSLVFPGGSCSPSPVGPRGAGSCDPDQALGTQGCGDTGVCTPLLGFEEDFFACRTPCTPSAGSSGCERRFYTCDLIDAVCVEGCQSDEECRAVATDTDGDGLQDTLVYDADSEATCDDATRRCRHPDGGGESGAACTRSDACEPEGFCLDQTLGGHPFPGGSCSKVACDIPGRECAGADSICTTVRTVSGGMTVAPACFARCTVGADAEGDRLGVEGHGAGCRAGYRCHYNGGAADEGICVGGEYNDVAEANIGAPCADASSCYSPYGLAACVVFGTSTGGSSDPVCTLVDCGAPGLPDDVCGEGNRCVVSAGDQTLCVAGCDSAEECAPGLACVDDDLQPRTRRVCSPACRADEDCREGQRCVGADDGTAGSCG